MQTNLGDTLYQQLFEYMLTVILVIDPVTVQIIEANPAACNFYGYTHEQITSLTLSDINIMPESDLRVATQGVIAETGKILQTSHRLASGAIRDVEVQFGLLKANDQSLLYAKVRDITDRLQAEKKLRQSEALYRLLAQNLPDSSVIMFDLDMRYTLAEGPYLKAAGSLYENIVGKLPQEIMPEVVLQVLLPIYQRALQGESFNYERVTENFAYQAFVTPIEDESGQIIGGMILSQDITERKRTEKLLIENLQKEHEFQNYLKALHEITIELTNVSDLDEFYKRAVELGLQRLGFDRLGLLLYNQEDSVAIGTYGTDSTGNRVAEHHLRIDPSSLTGILMRALQNEEHFVVDEHAQLYSNLEPMGTGWNAAAVLWHGTEKLGWLTTDNGVQHLPMTQTQLNVLALYAVTLGTLLAQKQTQVSVRESERRLRLVARNSPDVIYIMSLTEHKATYLNRPEFLGYSQSEIEGSGSLLNAIHPNDKDRVIAHWHEVMVNRELNPMGVIEYRLQDKSGQWRWIQSRETIFACASDGKPSQVLVTLTDIGERKQAEDKLTQERDLLRTLIDSSPDYIFIKDREGRYILSNIAHAQAASLDANGLVGKTAFEVFPPDLAAQFHADDQRVMQSGDALINMERITLDQRGNAKTVLTTKIPLRDNDGQVMSLVGISRDITARKQLEAQTIELAAERDRVKVLQRFVHDMSHDFRTPLAVINSSLYLLQKHTDPQKQQVYAKRAENQILRMDKLLEELLQMEQLDKGETAFQFSLTEINAFLAPLIRDYEPLVIPKQITLKFVSEADTCFARIDKVEFARVMTKLMDNAIAYTPEGGNITIRTNTQSRWVIISVQDTGIGIAPSDLPHIFERFYRADQARSTETGGSGLGLSIVQKIVEAHDGKVEAESTLGKGTMFSIKLPSS